MSQQKKLSEIEITPIEKQVMSEVLDLEKTYFNLLWELFTSDEFINDLLIIEKNIQDNYDSLEKTWDLKNKLKVPAERLTRHYIYKNLSDRIKGIYPFPISSDIAFITDDAVINIDVKTLDIVGNKGDISNLQFENNQSSFINNNLDEDQNVENSGVKVECLLPTNFLYENTPKTILTYFLTIIYKDDSYSFNLSHSKDFPTIQLKCLPNGKISSLFENDIVNNFKTYSYFKKKDGFPPIFLTDKKEKVKAKVEDFVKNNPNYTLIKGRTKTGAYSKSEIHPYYNTPGISFFPVSRKKKTEKQAKFYLEAVKCGNTNRVSNLTLENRFDSSDEKWMGIKKYIIK